MALVHVALARLIPAEGFGLAESTRGFQNPAALSRNSSNGNSGGGHLGAEEA
jgi:hypothetical protein